MATNTHYLEEFTVELRGAPIPRPLNKIAIHLYFILSWQTAHESEKTTERWELWQDKNAFHKFKTSAPEVSKQQCYGHIHKNLKAPNEGVGGGPSFHLKSWTDQEAWRIKESIDLFNEKYPFQTYYIAWPGPNSNTYISSILDDSHITYNLPKRAIGKDWRGVFQCKTNKELKMLRFQFCTFGFKHTTNFCWEFHFLGLTIGLNKSPEKSKE